MYDFLLLASLVLFAGVAIAYLRHPAASLAHPASFYLAFHGFIFVFRPLVARWYDFDFVYRLYEFQPSMANKITVILGANLAMVTFVLASLFIAPKPVAETPRSGFEHAREKLFWPILTTAGLLTPLALVAQFSNWTRRANHFEAMVRDASTGNLVNMQGNGWFTDAALFMAPLAVMLVWLSRYRWWGWAYFALFALAQAGTGSRHAIVFAVSALAICWLLEKGLKWFDWRAVAAGLLALVAFNQIVVDRGGAIRTLIDEDLGARYVSEGELDPLEHMDFANLEYFEYIVYAVPERTGTWDYFAHTLQVFTEPVPRALWKDKPAGSPVQYFSLWDYGQPIGMTASLPGIGWMSLGYPGIVIQALVFAVIFGMAYTLLLARNGGAVARLGYALVISLTVLGFRDGTLLTLVRTAPFYFGPLLLSLFLSRYVGFAPAAFSLSETPRETATTPAQRRRALAERGSHFRQ